MSTKANKISKLGRSPSKTLKEDRASSEITQSEIRKLKKALKINPKSLWKYLQKQEN